MNNESRPSPFFARLKSLLAVACSLLLFAAVLFIAVLPAFRDEQNGEPIAENPPQGSPQSPPPDTNSEGDASAPAESAKDPAVGENENPKAGETPPPAGSATPQDAAPTKPPAKGDEPQADWAIQMAQPPSTWSERAFELFDTRAAVPLVDELKQWFEPALLAPPPAFRTTNTSVGKCGVFRGIMRLTPPLDSAVALRLDLANSDLLRIHLFRGDAGVTLVHYSDDQWAAYTTKRHPGASKPARLRLAATDDYRASRTSFGKGPFEICFVPGEVAVTRGNVVLLRAAFDGLPSDVFFQGTASFQGIGIRRLSDTPPPLARELFVAYKPNELTWKSGITEQAKFVEHTSGAVELTASTAKKQAGVWAEVKDLGLSIVDVKLSKVTAGAGLFLSDAKGTPAKVLRFAHNTGNGELCAVLKSDDRFEFDMHRYDKGLTPSVSSDLWVRLAGCGNVFRVWVSSDALYWAHVGTANHSLASINSIGLQHVAQARGVAIQLDQIRVTPLSGVRGLASAELLQRAKACSKPTFDSWLWETARSLPAGASLQEWRMATAVKSVERWAATPLTQLLIKKILAEAIRSDRPREDVLDAIDDASFVFDTVGSDASLAGFTALYEQVALRGAADDADLFDDAIRRLFSTSITSTRRSSSPSDHWIGEELIRRLFAKDWRRLHDFLSVVRFYGWESRSPLFDWAATLASRATPMASSTNASKLSQGRWRPSIVEELDREAFNRISELESALNTGDPVVAAEIAAAIRDTNSAGIAPAPADADLSQSLSAALQDIWFEHPDVAKALNERHREIAELRLQQAIDHSDPGAARTIAEQFGHLESAARARLWLGDRSLSAGRIRQALAEYAHASECSAIAEEVSSRVALAMALVGENESKPDDTRNDEVVFSRAKYAAAEYRALLDKLAKSNKAPPMEEIDIQPRGFEVHFAGKLDGQLGKSPNQAVVRDSHLHAANWPIRQLAYTRAEDTVYVSNRFQIAAFALADGKRLWTSEKALGEPLRSQDWFLTRTRPIVHGDAVYSRFLYGAGTRLVKLNRKDGKVIWATPNNSSKFVVSDPFLADGRLLALVVGRGQQLSQLSLAEFDTDTGAIRLGERIFELRDRWWKMRYCAIQTLPDGFVAAMGGAIVACDYDGRVRWLRRQPQIPIDHAPSWMSQSFAPPFVADKAVIYAQPASKELVCAELATGRVRWRRLVSNLRGVWDAANGRVIARTGAGLTALHIETGATLWDYHSPQLQPARCFDDHRGMLISQVRLRGGRTQVEPKVVWLDLASGEPTHEHALPGFVHAQPRLGPFILGPKNVFTFYSTGANDADLDLIRLAPKGDAKPVARPLADAWTDSEIDPALLKTFQDRLSNWRLGLGSTVHPGGLAPSVHGKKDQLAFRLGPGKPLLLATSKPFGPIKQLSLQLGHNLAMQWKLEVMANGRMVHEQVIDKSSHPTPWFRLDVPWAKFPERSSVTLRMSHVTGTESDIYIESLAFE